MLAVIYDVHGNLAALDAVLADAEAAGAERYVLGGDFCGLGPWPAETLQKLRALPEATWIRGNWERWVAHPSEAPEDPVVQGGIAACAEAIGDAAVQELGALPEQALAGEARFCHASPLSDMRPFAPEPAEDEPELLAEVGESRLVFGHTHVQFRRRGERRIDLVNPGSVGMPLDGDPRAAYALIAPDHTLELRRVAYDHAASAAALRERYGAGSWAGTVAGRIEDARF